MSAEYSKMPCFSQQDEIQFVMKEQKNSESIPEVIEASFESPDLYENRVGRV